MSSSESEGRRNRHGGHNPDPGRGSGEPPGLTSQQATFMAGVAVTHAHQAAQLAEHATEQSLQYQQQAHNAQAVAQAIHDGAMQQQNLFVQVTADMRDTAEAALAERDRVISQNREEAQQMVRHFQGVQNSVETRAHEYVEGVRQEAQQLVEATRVSMESRAQSASESLHAMVEQRDRWIVSRDQEILSLQHQLAALQGQLAIAAQTPLPPAPTVVQAYEVEVPNTPNSMDFDLFGPTITGNVLGNQEVVVETAPIADLQEPVLPIEDGWSTQAPIAPKVLFPSSSPKAFAPVPKDPAGPLQPPPGLAQPSPSGLAQPSQILVQQNVQTVVPEPKAATPISQQPLDVQAWMKAEVEKMVAAQLASILGAQVGTISGGISSQAQIPMPIAASAAYPSQGAAPSAPVPQQPASAGVPILALPKGFNSPTHAVPTTFNIGSNRSRVSRSSESSSDSSPQSPARPVQCRICGGLHEEISCPHITLNASAPVAASPNTATSTKDFADEEEDTIRVKSLNDLTFPNPPDNAATSRGYVNQVLMAIGKLQKTSGSEVYLWAQDCLSLEDNDLIADKRFPRLDREIASKLIKTCRKGRFGLVFQQMVEKERSKSGGMPNGRVMLRYIFKYFQLEQDRIGMLGERNLLSLRMPGNSVADLEQFRDKYIYVMTTIPVDDLPREQTLFNHLIDELERNAIMLPKIQKAREAPHGSHRRTTDWLWSKVELAIQLDQQKRNRADFDRQLKLKPADGYAGTQNPKKPDVGGAAAEARQGDKPKNPKKEKKEKSPKKEQKEKKEKDVPANPANPKAKPKAKAKAKASGTTPPTTPRSAEAKRAADMTPAEKARTPCMFYAYNACNAKNCAFLHSDSNKYKGPPPKAIANAKAKGKPKAAPKVAASMAAIVHSDPDPVPANQCSIGAVPAVSEKKISWLWDTAAGRHLIGRQVLTPEMKKHLQESPNPVAFATGGGHQPGQESIAFEGSRLLEGDEVYVLRDCPPAQSIGKTVQDKGYLFVWDPRERVPYLVAPEDLNRCRIRIPRSARICASRVVENVPQYDEELTPRNYSSLERLAPTPATALPAAEPADDFDYAPSLLDEAPPLEDVAEADAPEAPIAEGAADSAPPEPMPEAVAEGAAPSAPPHPLDDRLLVELGEGVPFREDVLRKEADSDEHKRTHFPKNPFCKLCNIAKNTSMRVARKPDGKADDFVDPPRQPYEQLATDDVILAKGTEFQGVGIGGVLSHHVVRDLYSGARVAYPLPKRDISAHTKNFRHFIGLRANELAPKTFIKCDEAGELEQAAHAVGFTPETSLPNRWPHNSRLERDIREEKECCRVVHLQSGLPYEFHTHSYPYACLSMSFDRPALCDKEKTQWEALTKSKFEGRRLCFGQLCYYRKKSQSRKTLEPNMAPALFLGWRIDPGLRYRDVVRVLDYQEFRTKGLGSSTDVPEAELYVEEGPPVFPLANARALALAHGGDPEKVDLPDIALQEVPFPPDGGIAAPSTPGVKGRSVYITVERILRFKETPGCKACLGKTRTHTSECKFRFAQLVDEEKRLEEGKRLSKEAAALEEGGAASSAPEHDKELKPPEFELPLDPAAFMRPLEPHDEELARELLDPEDFEAAPRAAAHESDIATSVSGAASLTHSPHPPSMVELCKQALPMFGKTVHACATDVIQTEPEPSQPRRYAYRNRRGRRRIQRSLVPGPKSTMFEFACSPNSKMGEVHLSHGINHVRLCREMLDLTDEQSMQQLLYQIEQAGEEAPPHLWASIPCTSGSPWQYINLKKGGRAFKRRLSQMIFKSKKMFKHFVEAAHLVLTLGGTVTFEWPQHSMGWKREDVAQFFASHEQFTEVNFDGCSVGVISKKGQPIKKPWKIMTTSPRIAEAFSNCHCIHDPSQHQRCEGSETTRSENYPTEMCMKIAQALYPSHCQHQPAPAMPCTPVTQEPQPHRENEQMLKHVSPLSGFEDLAVAVEADATANAMVCELLDHERLLAQALDIQHPASSNEEINAMVTKLLSRAEMLSDPRALEAIRAEADGLVKAGTWDLASVREKDEIKQEAKASGVSVHFGQLMTIASIKFAELASHLQKMKGRIVYRGDCAKDEHGAAAVYQELSANPTSVQGLNACLAYGLLPGHKATAADAIKAYVQALLSSRYKTWIELPPELRPSWWRQKFVRPVVLLVKALYGHPDAGGLWERHLKKIIQTLGGEEVPEYPGNFYFPDTKLLLSTYVDDLTLSGPSDQHDDFWKKLTAQVDVEPPEPIYRILGRNHVLTQLTQTEGHEQCAAFRAQDGMLLDMADYAHQTVELYLKISGAEKLKAAATPFCPEGSISHEDESSPGELAPNACKILMKALWLARLARPDIIKPINDLATKVQAWTKSEDKKLLRLIQYINSTTNYRLAATVGDQPDDLELHLYVDADFAGEKQDAKSTSGGFLALVGPSTFVPLAWLSKRQTSTSRSTTESEVVSLAHSLYQEGLPALQLWERLLQRSVTLRIHEDNQATILVVRKGYSPKLRHITRTHKVNLSCMSEIIHSDTVELDYCSTDLQIADIFTKALAPQKWGNALKLLGIRTDYPDEIPKPK